MNRRKRIESILQWSICNHKTIVRTCFFNYLTIMDDLHDDKRIQPTYPAKKEMCQILHLAFCPLWHNMAVNEFCMNLFKFWQYRWQVSGSFSTTTTKIVIINSQVFFFFIFIYRTIKILQNFYFYLLFYVNRFSLLKNCFDYSSTKPNQQQTFLLLVHINKYMN